MGRGELKSGRRVDKVKRCRKVVPIMAGTENISQCDWVKGDWLNINESCCELDLFYASSLSSPPFLMNWDNSENPYSGWGVTGAVHGLAMLLCW